MQEEVENRTIALAVSTSRMTGRVLKSALIKLLAEIKKSRDRPPQIPHGKQSVKALIGQNAGVSNIEITDKNIKSFEQVARKYGVDFTLQFTLCQEDLKKMLTKSRFLVYLLAGVSFGRL